AGERGFRSCHPFDGRDRRPAAGGRPAAGPPRRRPPRGVGRRPAALLRPARPAGQAPGLPRHLGGSRQRPQTAPPQGRRLMTGSPTAATIEASAVDDALLAAAEAVAGGLPAEAPWSARPAGAANPSAPGAEARAL